MAFYEPLDTACNEIRLIRIRLVPSIGSERFKIECRFQIASLDDEPVYDALSYTWGSPNDWFPSDEEYKEIYIDGNAIRITDSLFNAFITIWNSCRPKPIGALWVDALCINQSDSAKRSSQVRLMASIYSHARRVRIWLGLGGRQVHTLFRAVENDNIMTLLNNDSATWLDGFQQVVSSSWWRRLWIVQEAVLAADAMVHCGISTVSWANLINALLIVDTETDPDAHPSPAFLINLGKRAFHSLKFLASLFRGYPIASRENMDIHYVVSLLSKLAKQKVTDERDRVYGALGMLPKALVISPDYNLSIVEVYRAFTQRLITWSGSLDILRLCDSIDENGELSSWIPGLAGGVYSIMPVTHVYDASGEASVFARINKNNELFARAHIVDKIAFVDSFRITDDENPLFEGILLDRHRKFMKRCYEAAVVPWISFQSQPFERSARFWSTLRHQCSVFVVDNANGTSSLDIEDALYQELDAWILGDKQSLSEPAQAFHAPKIEDELALVAGCSEPMILRPELEPGRRIYRIVGPCFCQDLAFGEYVRRACRKQLQPHRPTALQPPLEMCLQSIRLLHQTSISYIHVEDLQQTTRVLEQILSHVLDHRDSGVVEVESRKALAKDIEDLCAAKQEACSTAARVQSRLSSYPSIERETYLRIVSAVFVVAYTNHIRLRGMGESNGPCEIFEVILCATGLVILEGLIYSERIKSSGLELEKGEMMARAIEDTLGTCHEDAVPAFYQQVKRLAHNEAEAERIHNTLFDGIVLV